MKNLIEDIKKNKYSYSYKKIKYKILKIGY